MEQLDVAIVFIVGVVLVVVLNALTCELIGACERLSAGINLIASLMLENIRDVIGVCVLLVSIFLSFKIRRIYRKTIRFIRTRLIKHA